MSTKSTLAIALTAIAAGAALGVLFAPASGSETRRKIARKGADLRDRLNDVIQEGSDLIDQMKGEASDLAKSAKDAASNLKDEARTAANKAGAHATSGASNGGYKS